MAEKYQQMLRDTRKEHAKEISAYREEAAALREKLNAQTDTAFSRLKQAALDVANVSTPAMPSDRQLERLLELEDLTIQQKQEMKRLRQEVRNSLTHALFMKVQVRIALYLFCIQFVDNSALTLSITYITLCRLM